MTDTTTIRPSTLRPGLLVSLKTTVSGNVHYAHTDIEATHTTDAGEQRSRWETERVITDPEEHARAIQARSKCITAVRRVCSQSPFGMLCPQTKADELAAAIAEARAIAETFNAGANLTRISVYAIVGKVAGDEAEAQRAINAEVRDLIETMQDGVKRLDVETIRKAARDAKQLGQMLTPEAAARVESAIEAARAMAKKIVAAGEQAAAEVDTMTLAKLAQARTAFLDVETPAAEVAQPAETARALDLMPERPTLFDLPAAPVPALDIEPTVIGIEDPDDPTTIQRIEI